MKLSSPAFCEVERAAASEEWARLLAHDLSELRRSPDLLQRRVAGYFRTRPRGEWPRLAELFTLPGSMVAATRLGLPLLDEVLEMRREMLAFTRANDFVYASPGPHLTKAECRRFVNERLDERVLGERVRSGQYRQVVSGFSLCTELDYGGRIQAVYSHWVYLEDGPALFSDALSYSRLLGVSHQPWPQLSDERDVEAFVEQVHRSAVVYRGVLESYAQRAPESR